MKYRKRPIYIITDGHPVYKAKKVKKYIEDLKDKLTIFLLPPYAPDLNPDELVWNQMWHMGTSKNHWKKMSHLRSGWFLIYSPLKKTESWSSHSSEMIVYPLLRPS